MDTFLVIFYSAVFLIALVVLAFNVLNVRKLKKRVGMVRTAWSTLYNFDFPENRVILPLLGAYFLWCVYQIAARPESNSGYYRLLILIILLAVTPRWTGAIGSRGILHRMSFFPWESIMNQELIDRKGRKYLRLKVLIRLDSDKTVDWTIRLPRKAEKALSA